MKKVFITACLMTFAFMISAQGGQGGQGGQRQGGGMRQQTPEQIAQQQEAVKKELNLNDKQFADYKKVEEEYQKSRQAAMQAGGGGGGFDREAMTKMTTDRNTKLKAIFTADQYKKFEERLAQQQQQRGQGGQGGGQRQGGGGGGN